MVTLRRATVQDAKQLAQLGRRLFEETFAAQNDPSDMAIYLAQAFGALQQDAELADQRVAVWLAESEGEAVGYAQCIVGASTPSDIPSPEVGLAVELQRFYVDRRWHGTGVARQLMACVVAHARSVQSRVLWLGVWEHNPRAIRFYEREGFVVCGSQRFQLGADTQTDRVMWRSVESDGVRR